MARSFDQDATTVYSRPSSDGSWASRFDIVVSPPSTDPTAATATTTSACHRRTTSKQGQSHELAEQHDAPRTPPIAAINDNDDDDYRHASAQQEQADDADLQELRRQLSEAEAALIANVSQWQFHWHEMAEVERLRRMVRESEQRQSSSSSSSSHAPPRKSLSRSSAASHQRRASPATPLRRRSSSCGQTHTSVVSCLSLNFTSGFRRSIDRAFSGPRRSLVDANDACPERQQHTLDIANRSGQSGRDARVL
ncbi:hypothetical protein SYNPS1DRAFT_30104 [Syncephalis pseudoplumigaleata]|uniref:Uncharacterized protein n=1 Tax=Syncephalis pseudoplumigaleata TaxID=1712513 RepID=A0A4P9YYP4_9FUNG|nr:hypothetical protein SYNPS1DRAFT_30104 [Syncephalis pseudoplumigaleata]|eukprot:RKP24130.1 hypothetical protein SYNPS1DRAFT_30104 [Syncephalis pseudoplumigaleata]